MPKQTKTAFEKARGVYEATSFPSMTDELLYALVCQTEKTNMLLEKLIDLEQNRRPEKSLLESSRPNFQRYE